MKVMREDFLEEQAPHRHEDDDAIGTSEKSLWRRRRMVAVWTSLLVLVGATVAVVAVMYTTPSASSAADSPSSPLLTSGTKEERAKAIAAFINSVTLTNRTIAYSSTSRAETQDLGTAAVEPQLVMPVEELALQWLIERDPIMATVVTTVPLSSEQSFRLRQRYALLTLWFQQELQHLEQQQQQTRSSQTLFQSTQPKKWTNVAGWTYLDECEWFGVTCTPRAPDGGEAASRMVVTSIHLNFNNLRGTVPVDLGLLTSIESFRVNTNYLTGTLPWSLGQWTQLVNFSVYKNALTGSIPESTSSWVNVQSILMQENQLNGTLPSMPLGSWTKLQEFNVVRNALTGSVPSSVGQWSNIHSAQFSVNRLNGTLPDTIGQWTAIEEFRISSNALTGTIPDSVSSWRYVRDAYFHDNNITGAMPTGLCDDALIANLTSLVADCSANEITCACCTYCF
jgi:Flp pilus assembly protein TadG